MDMFQLLYCSWLLLFWPEPALALIRSSTCLNGHYIRHFSIIIVVRKRLKHGRIPRECSCSSSSAVSSLCYSRQRLAHTTPEPVLPLTAVISSVSVSYGCVSWCVRATLHSSVMTAAGLVCPALPCLIAGTALPLIGLSSLYHQVWTLHILLLCGFRLKVLSLHFHAEIYFLFCNNWDNSLLLELCEVRPVLLVSYNWHQLDQCWSKQQDCL